MVYIIFVRFIVNRTPPKNVRELLRQEVNFGCPVQNCGTPYLMYHHFDPPWHVWEHHEPKGMIALCPTHHFNADGGSWKPDQLRRMKEAPFVTDKTKKERYDYLRKDTVCLAGTIVYPVKEILVVEGKPVIWFERDSEGYDRLNLIIRDSEGRILLRMEDNDFVSYPKFIFDLICPPQGKELQIISSDRKTNFTIRFDECTLFDFGNLLSNIGFRSDQMMKIVIEAKCQDFVPLWTMTGTLLLGRNHLEIVPGRLTEMNLNNTIQGFSMIRYDTAVTFKDGMFSIG